MKVKNISEWRAIEIAKVYLLGSDLIELRPANDNWFDFVAYGKRNPMKFFSVAVVATKYSPAGIKNNLHKKRSEFTMLQPRVLVLYINYETEKGYYETMQRSLNNPIIPIEMEALKRSITSLLRY